jgi:hypothetical protein
VTTKWIAILLLAAAPLVAADQQSGRLSFSATLESIRVNARPDDVITRQFKLTLDPQQPRSTFHAKVEDFWRSEDGTQSFYGTPGTLRRSCAKWVGLNPVDATVSATETLTVRISITVPHELPSGGYWCALTVDEVPDPLVETAGVVGVRFLASVSTGIFVYVGDVRREASILDLRVSADSASLRVRNDGNTPLGIEGKLEFFSGAAASPTATVTLPRTTVFTEPSIEGAIAVKLPAAVDLPAGTYRLRAILDFGADHYVGAEREVLVSRGGAPRDRD